MDHDEHDDADILNRLYALAVTSKEQGAPQIGECAKDAAEAIMLLQGEVASLQAEYEEKYELTNELVLAIKQYVTNAEGDPVLGPAINQWIRVVRYESG
jgi:hypothetical protein|tara:strand:- start:331 stop:627 length:297 start_codon:yes stop_codon:yes gene_type:complete